MTAQNYEYLLQQEENRAQYNRLKLAISHGSADIESYLGTLQQLDVDELLDIFISDGYLLINCIYHSQNQITAWNACKILFKYLPIDAQKQSLLGAFFFDSLDKLDSWLVLNIIQEVTQSWPEEEIENLCYRLLHQLPYHSIKKPPITKSIPVNNLTNFITSKLINIDSQKYPFDYNHIFSNAYIWTNDEAISNLLSIIHNSQSAEKALARYLFGVHLNDSPFHHLCKRYPAALKVLFKCIDSSYFFLGFYHYFYNGIGDCVAEYPPLLEYLRSLDQYSEQATEHIFSTLYTHYSSPNKIKEILLGGDQYETVLTRLTHHPQKILPLIPSILSLDRRSQIQVFRQLQPKNLSSTIEDQLGRHLLEFASIIAERQNSSTDKLNTTYLTLLKSLEKYRESTKSAKNCEELYKTWTREIDDIKDELYTYQNRANFITNSFLCLTGIGFLVLLARYAYYNLADKSDCLFFAPIISTYRVKDKILETLHNYEKSIRPT